jgi:hypothetical protein
MKKEMPAKSMFANMPEISDEKKAEFERLADMIVVRPRKIPQFIHVYMGLRPLPVLFVPNNVA